MGGRFVVRARPPELTRKGTALDQPVGQALDRSLVENRDQIERAELEIDAFISRRAQQQQRIKAEQEAWVESARAYNARRHREMREQWCAYHHDQADRLRASLVALIAHHEQLATMYDPGDDAA
jgi:hypothetical protein